MIAVLIWGVIFVVSLAALVKSADYFTTAAEKIGVALRISPFVVGVTIVSIGTSLPELVTSIISVVKQSPEIVAANVFGSNIANIFLVLGIAAIVGKRLKLFHEIISVDLPLLAGSTFLLVFTVWDGVFSWFDGLLALALFIVYIAYTVNFSKEHPDKEIKKEMKAKLNKRTIEWKSVGILVVSAVFLYFSANYLVESILSLSTLFNIGTEVIAISAVAIGTSLPELTVSVTAARKGKAEIAIGNVLGSNITNALLVMGVPALIGTIGIPKVLLNYTLPAFALPTLLLATVLYVFIIQDKTITQWEGWMLVIFYVFFLSTLFV